MATHSSILAWRIPVDRGAWWATVHGVSKSLTWLSFWAHRHLYTECLKGKRCFSSLNQVDNLLSFAVVVQLPSHAWLFATSWTAACPCLSPPPGVCPSSCPLNGRCHPTISSSVIFSFCPQSFPASGSFPMSQLFTSGGQSIGASVSVLPMSIQDWYPLRLTGLISLLFKGL